MREEAAATPAGGFDLKYIRRERTAGQAIGTGAWTQIVLAGGSTVNQDATRFGINGADADVTDIKKVGRYGFKCQVKWDPTFAGLTSLRVAASAAFGWHFGINWTEPGGAAGDGATTAVLYVERDVVGGTSGVEFHARQDSGAGQTLQEVNVEIAHVADYTLPADQF